MTSTQSVALGQGRHRHRRLVVLGERRGRVVVDVGQLDGEHRLGQGAGQPVVGVVDDRERLAPEPLAAEQPVPQLGGDRARAGVPGLEPADDGVLGLGHAHPVQADLVVGAVDRRPLADVRLVFPVLGRLHGPHDGQVEQLGERPVTLVLPGHGHDGPGAVAHQHVVGHEHRDGPAGGGVGRVAADEHAGLLTGLDLALDLGAGAGLAPVGGDRLGRGGVAARPRRGRGGAGTGHVVRPGGRRELVDQGMLGRQHHVGGAEQRVGPRGEHVDARPRRPVVAHGRERDHGTLGPPDPVALLQLDGLGPVEHVEVVQQPVGVGGDAHHPLPERPPEHREVAPVAAAVGGDLLVGQHRPQAGAPVDRRLLHVGQAMGVDDLPALGGGQVGPRAAGRVGALVRLALAGVELGHEVGDGAGAVGLGVVPGVEDLQEDPLRPPVVAGVDGADRPAGVVGEAQAPQLPAHGGDVGLGGGAGVLAGLDGVLLGRQAEGVVADGVDHVVPGHALVAGVHVGADVAERVPDVQARAAGVREHVEHVELGRTRGLVEPGAEVAHGVGGEERALALPAVLPVDLDAARELGRVAVRGRVGSGRLAARRRGLGHGHEGYRAVPGGPNPDRPGRGAAEAWDPRSRPPGGRRSERIRTGLGTAQPRQSDV